MMYVYCMCEEDQADNGPCKIGVASNVQRRLSNLQAGNWRHLAIAWQVQVPCLEDARTLERHLLAMFRPSIYTVSSEKRLPSEWVSAAPASVYRWAKEYADAVNEYQVGA